MSPDELRERLLDGMVSRLRRGPVHWMPGARRLLEETSAAGVPRALVSSSLRVVVDAVLDAIGREHLPVTVSGDDVARTKPHPDPYLLAARTLGVDPAACVALEDSATGATSARAAGCYTVAVPSLAHDPAGRRPPPGRLAGGAGPRGPGRPRGRPGLTAQATRSRNPRPACSVVRRSSAST